MEGNRNEINNHSIQSKPLEKTYHKIPQYSPIIFQSNQYLRRFFAKESCMEYQCAGSWGSDFYTLP